MIDTPMTDTDIGKTWKTADSLREPWMIKELIIRIVHDRAVMILDSGYFDPKATAQAAGQSALKEACLRFGIPYREFIKYIKDRASAGG